LLAVVGIVTVTDFALVAFGVIVQAVVCACITLFTTGLLLALDVALFTTGLLTLDVTLITTGLFAAARTVIDAVRRGVSGLVADSAGLVKERWTDDFSVGSGLVFDVVAGVFR
jgi:hypothetical protein